VEISGRGSGWAYPLEKSAPGSKNTSIDRLYSWNVNLRKFAFLGSENYASNEFVTYRR
jgi:hypothetical protein